MIQPVQWWMYATKTILSPVKRTYYDIVGRKEVQRSTTTSLKVPSNDNTSWTKYHENSQWYKSKTILVDYGNKILFSLNIYARVSYLEKYYWINPKLK